MHDFDIWNDAAGRALLQRTGELLAADVSSVPFTVVGDEVFAGYLSDASTGEAIRRRALHCLVDACPDSVRPLLGGNGAAPARPAAPSPAIPKPLPASIALPLVGEVAIQNLSLPLLTVVLGALDGFNPCAMWTLLMLLGLLIGVPDRRRRWLLGGAFIFASAAVYFLFLAAWLNLFLFLGLLWWVRLAIGAVALAGGGYYLREYVLNRAPVCAVTAPERRQRVIERLRRLAQHHQLWLALAGIVLLAGAVNLVELLCSAGIPAVYTQVLALSAVPVWQYYLYLLLYILVFMLDDLIVFFTVLRTLEAPASARATRAPRISSAGWCWWHSACCCCCGRSGWRSVDGPSPFFSNGRWFLH